VEGAWRTAPNHSRPAFCMAEAELKQRIIQSAIHKEDTEEVAQPVAGQGSFSVSQSNLDYAVLGERGDPRGRKSDVGPAATNPR
jgi:hypothetical protein